MGAIKFFSSCMIIISDIVCCNWLWITWEPMAIVATDIKPGRSAVQASSLCTCINETWGMVKENPPLVLFACEHVHAVWHCAWVVCSLLCWVIVNVDLDLSSLRITYWLNLLMKNMALLVSTDMIRDIFSNCKRCVVLRSRDQIMWQG